MSASSFVSWLEGYSKERARPSQVAAIHEVINRFQKENTPIFLTLPTGYGKTMIGLSPYMYQLYTNQFDISSWLCYVLPTRSMCDGLAKKLREKYLNGILDPANIKTFHGGIEEAEELFGEVAITTFDTFVLSYARRTIGGLHLEKPAGFIATSCLVFDEAHMIQDEFFYSFSLLKAVVERLFRVGVPILFMTATMPKKISDYLFSSLNIVRIPDAGSGFQEHVDSYRGTLRRAEFVERSLNKLTTETEWKRLLVVCNTVERAARAYDDLNVDALKLLIHSRLRKEERIRREKLLYKLMRPKATCDDPTCGVDIVGPPYNYKELIQGGEPDYIVLCDECARKYAGVKVAKRVAAFTTQVVEAGLDISADLLITELAPADALVQRCGRCARFKGEEGTVYIAPQQGNAPYPGEVVKRTEEELRHKAKLGILEDSLTAFDHVQSMVDEVYNKFEPNYYGGRMENTVQYLRGKGLLTFTVDWRMIKSIATRPEAQLTLVAPASFGVADIDEEKDSLYLNRYRLRGNWITMKAEEILIKITKQNGENAKLAIKASDVRASSFSISMGSLRQKRIPSYLKFKGYVFKLFPYTTKEGKRETVYIIYAMKAERPNIEEGIYMINPTSYSEEKGLVELD
jgi:CRISPR-associated endonuclease/helicase Cas3